MITTRLAMVAVVGATVAGCGVFDRSAPPKPPSTTIVDTPSGDLEVITIPGFDGAAPDEFENPELSGDTVADYLAYGGPTNVPLFEIGNGRLIGLAVYTDLSMGTSYTYAVTDATDNSIEDSLNQIVGSIVQKYPDFTAGTIDSETRDYFDARYARLEGSNEVNTEELYVGVTTDSRYPNVKFVYFRLEMPSGGRPDPLPIGSAVDAMIGPLRDAAGLTNTDVTDLRIYVGWELTSTDGGEGMVYVPLHTQIGMNAGNTSPEQVEATIQPLLDSDWKQDPAYVWVVSRPTDPDTTAIVFGIPKPDRL